MISPISNKPDGQLFYEPRVDLRQGLTTLIGFDDQYDSRDLNAREHRLTRRVPGLTNADKDKRGPSCVHCSSIRLPSKVRRRREFALAGSREIESYWYPVWLCYPAGHAAGQQGVDAPPHKISIEQTVEMAKDFELLVLFTSTPGFHVRREDGGDDEGRSNPKLKVASSARRSPVEPEKSLRASPRHRFRRAPRVRLSRSPTTPRASRSKSCPASASARTARSSTIPRARVDRESRRAAWVTKVYKRDLDVTPLQRSVPAESVHFVLHVARMPGDVHLLPVAADALAGTAGGCARPTTWRTKSATRWSSFRTSRKSSSTTTPSTTARTRTIELCKKLKPLNFTWSCTSRVTTDYDTLKAMKEAGCRLLIVGYESGDPQILKNIKKGATVDMAQRFTAQLQEARACIDPRRLHHRAARRDARQHPHDHRFRQAAGHRDHSGLDRASLSRHRVRFLVEEA